MHITAFISQRLSLWPMSLFGSQYSSWPLTRVKTLKKRRAEERRKPTIFSNLARPSNNSSGRQCHTWGETFAPTPNSGSLLLTLVKIQTLATLQSSSVPKLRLAPKTNSDICFAVSDESLDTGLVLHFCWIGWSRWKEKWEKEKWDSCRFYSGVHCYSKRAHSNVDNWVLILHHYIFLDGHRANNINYKTTLTWPIWHPILTRLGTGHAIIVIQSTVNQITKKAPSRSQVQEIPDHPDVSQISM